MRYYTQNTMKLELTKEEMACCKKFANFLNTYAEGIDDGVNTTRDMVMVISDMDINDNVDSAKDRKYLNDVYHVNIEITNY